MVSFIHSFINKFTNLFTILFEVSHRSPLFPVHNVTIIMWGSGIFFFFFLWMNVAPREETMAIANKHKNFLVHQSVQWSRVLTDNMFLKLAKFFLKLVAFSLKLVEIWNWSVGRRCSLKCFYGHVREGIEGTPAGKRWSHPCYLWGSRKILMKWNLLYFHSLSIPWDR